MQNVKDIEGAIKQLEQEVHKETHELQEKEAELHKKETEEAALKQEIPAMQKELEQKKHLLYQCGMIIPKLKSEIAILKREQIERHNELLRVQKSYQDTLRKSNVKLR